MRSWLTGWLVKKGLRRIWTKSNGCVITSWKKMYRFRMRGWAGWLAACLEETKNSWRRPNVSMSYGNIENLKICPKHTIRQRSKMCGFPLEIQQLWNVCKINESMNVAKFEYNLGNMKDYEKQLKTAKKGNSEKAYIYCRFWRKFDDEAPRQKGETPRMLIFTVVFDEFWW